MRLASSDGSYRPSASSDNCWASDQIRTDDPLITSEMLYQLSYKGKSKVEITPLMLPLSFPYNMGASPYLKNLSTSTKDVW